MCTISTQTNLYSSKCSLIIAILAKKTTDDCSTTKERINLGCVNVDTYLSNERMTSTMQFLSLFEGYS